MAGNLSLIHIYEAHTYLQEHTRVPLLLAANLESGGNGLVLEGTPYGLSLIHI